MSANTKIINTFKHLIPKLSKDLHKGQNGRVGIVGGSKEYSGAPYFASISSLRAGADLSYVVTTNDAAPIIKSYSPEMIVYPILDGEDSQLEVQVALSKVHSLIIGPGLGRSEVAFRALKTSVEYAKSRNIPIIIDADGLYILSFDSTIVHGYEKCILTPNLMEFKRLYEASFGKEEAYDETKEHSTLEAQCKAVERLATTFKNLTILKKGRVDIISDGNKTIVNDMEGCLKRCGGIGDILTGTLGTFAFWCSSSQHIEFLSKQEVSQPNLIAAYCATVLTKECSRQAFKKFHRSLLAVDIIEEIAGSFYKIFDKD